MGRTLKLKNVIYFPNFNSCGGTETYCYEFCLKYGKDYDISVVYQYGDPTMMKHIAEVAARVIKWREGDKIICDTFILGYGHEIIDSVEANTIIQTFHADYICRHLNPCFDPRIKLRFGVSDNTTKGIREHYDWAKDIQTMYNPYTPKKPRKVLHFVSATRLSPEKGYNRLVTFAEALDNAGIPFHWDIYTDIPRESFNKSVAIMPCRMDVLDFIADADYLVQLSDTEGFSYTIVEALSVGTPVICTEFLVAQENGVIDGETGFILPFDMSKIPIDRIVKGLKKFKYTPRETHYEQYLVPGTAEYEDIFAGDVVVRCKKIFLDIEAKKQREFGEEWTVNGTRAEKLIDLNLVDLVE
jgi:glycosyltransferase involved in cell wall biosynthesis